MGRFQLVATIDMEHGISTATGCTTLKDLGSMERRQSMHNTDTHIITFCHKLFICYMRIRQQTLTKDRRS
jgi:hypothetical protein